jgi:hypothetical protein
MGKVPGGFVDNPPTITIREHVVRIRGKTVGGGTFKITTTVGTLEKFGDRMVRALARYAAGETDILVDD